VNSHSRSARPITNKINFIGGILTVRYGQLKPTGLTIILMMMAFPVQNTLVEIKLSNLKLLTNLSLLDPVEYYAQGLLSPLILPSPFPWLWFR
jgi:hypothetical protein